MLFRSVAKYNLCVRCLSHTSSVACWLREFHGDVECGKFGCKQLHHPHLHRGAGPTRQEREIAEDMKAEPVVKEEDEEVQIIAEIPKEKKVKLEAWEEIANTIKKEADAQMEPASEAAYSILRGGKRTVLKEEIGRAHV